MGGTPSTDALSTDTLTDSRMAGRCARLRVRRIQLGLEYRLLAVEFLAALGLLLRRQVQAIEVVLPRRIFRPAVRRLHRRTRCVRGLEQVERHRDETSLARQVARLAAGVSQGEVAEEESRNTGMLDNVTRATHHDGGDAMCFEVAGSQTHGLVADGSRRDQNRRVDRILAAQLQYLRRVSFSR